MMIVLFIVLSRNKLRIPLGRVRTRNPPGRKKDGVFFKPMKKKDHQKRPRSAFVSSMK